MSVAQGAVELRLESVMGFTGRIPDGLKYTPCGRYIIYPLGSMIVYKNIHNDKQAFLEGHTGDVTCLAISRDGRRLASGQTKVPGVKAEILLWDLDAARRNCESGQAVAGGCMLHRCFQHLGYVQDVSFSHDGRFFASLGGRDDNALVVWDVETASPICGQPAAPDSALVVRWLNGRSDRLVTSGNYHLRVWQVDFSLPKLHAVDAKMGSVKRVIVSMDIQADDSCAWCGTHTGDVIKVKIDREEVRSMTATASDSVTPSFLGCSKDRFAIGVRSIKCVVNPSTGNTNALVGAGDGGIVYINQQLNTVAGRKAQVLGSVTSIAMDPNGRGFYVGTDQSNRYYVSIDLSSADLRASCHAGSINDVCFPRGSSDLVVSASRADIRVWNLRMRSEILRIQVPNLECFCCGITTSGSTIVSGWDDGKVRAFYPESGRLKFVIADAHAERVTALACVDDDSRPPWRLVTGGQDGRVRVWSITSSHQTLVHSMKEHRGAVSAIRINREGTQAVSSSADGSCIVWDLRRHVRLMAFFEPTIFAGAVYHPDESQILTCGTNHKIAYWDAVDGTCIRVIDGSLTSAMTALDIDADGEYFVTGSEDKSLKVWHYDDGLAVAVGRGHSSTVNKVRISPDNKHLVSVGAEGALMVWALPSKRELHAVIERDAAGR